MTVFTADDAVAALREQHAPSVLDVVEVTDGDGWREPTTEDRAADLTWWCDGCQRPAKACSVMPLLDLIGTEVL